MNEVLVPFTSGALELLTTMLGLEASLGTDEAGEDCPLAAWVDLQGDKSGRLVLSFPQPTAEFLVAEMLAMDLDELDEELLHDGVGEVANMIAGYAKTRLAKTPYQFQLHLPSVVFGEEERLALAESYPVAHRHRVDTEGGYFEVAVHFKS